MSNVEMCTPVDDFFQLHRNLSHIFRNLDTQDLILALKFKKPKKTSKKYLSIIVYQNQLETNIEKIQTILKYKRFNGLRACGCYYCFESYESFKSAFCNLVDKLSETLDLINKMKNKQKDKFYINRVSVILKKIQHNIGLI